MARARIKTDMYLATVEQAVAHPGRWVEVPRRFDTEFNASITGSCLRDGYLRVQPREGDIPVLVQGRRYIRTAAPVECRVHREPNGWALSVRAD
jgi:hypothetical protein